MVRDTVLVNVFFICHCRPVFGCCCFGKSFSTCIWLPTDLPPSDEQNLEIQGSVTNCSDAVTAGQGENMFNDRQYCKYITLQNSRFEIDKNLKPYLLHNYFICSFCTYLCHFPFLADCEMCHQHFINQCEVHGPPSFTYDSPATKGTPQRALLTLPQGLVIGRSSIPNAGLGVFNQGQTVPLGMHFGPFDGEETSEEKALDSSYSWVVSVYLSVFSLFCYSLFML